jgi:hypothetical protein
MVRSRASAAFNSEFKDFVAPLDTSILAPADITGAKANGSATGARVTDPALLEPDEVQVATVSTSRQGTEGAGTTAARDHVLEVNVPDPSGENLHAGALHVASQSTITASPPAAEQMSVAESLDVNVMEGVVTADVVRAVAEVRADPLGATYNSLSSSFKTCGSTPTVSDPRLPATVQGHGAGRKEASQGTGHLCRNSRSAPPPSSPPGARRHSPE